MFQIRRVNLTRELGGVPTQGDLLLAARRDTTFPSEKVFRRLGTKVERAALVVKYCESRSADDAVARLWGQVKPSPQTVDARTGRTNLAPLGFVYLTKFGRHYKIGWTNAVGRMARELAIQLPEKSRTVHLIETDDPEGIEASGIDDLSPNGAMANGSRSIGQTLPHLSGDGLCERSAT